MHFRHPHEHIMPQNEDLSREWRDELGPAWEGVHDTKLHTLGNLTLTGYNSEYSDRPFAEKRDMTGGFKESPLRLNEGLAETENWNEEAIDARAARLARRGAGVWVAPRLDREVLDAYRPRAEKTAPAYSIADHMHLAEGTPARQLFADFRLQVLALDPCVTEEFLKLYVAFKAETNFVDVVPQASQLRLSLNMQFHELIDPRAIAKDVTNLGRWGNGDVEIGLSSAEDLPYVMGLVRQSFEKQMGSDAADS
jgi:predicted transport protein